MLVDLHRDRHGPTSRPSHRLGPLCSRPAAKSSSRPARRARESRTRRRAGPIIESTMGRSVVRGVVARDQDEQGRAVGVPRERTRVVDGGQAVVRGDLSRGADLGDLQRLRLDRLNPRGVAQPSVASPAQAEDLEPVRLPRDLHLDCPEQLAQRPRHGRMIVSSYWSHGVVRALAIPSAGACQAVPALLAQVPRREPEAKAHWFREAAGAGRCHGTLLHYFDRDARLSDMLGYPTPRG